MADLKPCPFCGGEAVQKRVEQTILGTEYFSVICTTCHCQTAGNQDIEKSIAIWNTRKPMEAVEEQLKQQVAQYQRRAEEHKDYEDYHARYWAKYGSYKHALEIVRNGGKE